MMMVRFSPSVFLQLINIFPYSAIEIVLSKSMYCFNESDPKAPLCFNLTTRNGNSECPVEFDISVVLNITRLKGEVQNAFMLIL